MKKLLEVKETIAEVYKDVEGFTGVGIGRTNGLEVVRVYVESLTCPAAKRIARLKTYDGIPLNIKVVGKIIAGV